MGTPIGQQTTLTPSIKLRKIGDHVDIALVDLAVVPWTEFGTGQPKIGKDGKPRSQDRLTAVVINGVGVVNEDKVDRPAKPDEVVAVYLAAHKRWDWIQAQKGLEGGLQCGDVVRIRYERDETSSAAGSNDKKVWSFRIRHAKPEEAERSKRCEELRQGAAAGGTPLTAANGPEYSEEPF